MLRGQSATDLTVRHQLGDPRQHGLPHEVAIDVPPSDFAWPDERCDGNPPALLPPSHKQGITTGTPQHDPEETEWAHLSRPHAER